MCVFIYLYVCVYWCVFCIIIYQIHINSNKCSFIVLTCYLISNTGTILYICKGNVVNQDFYSYDGYYYCIYYYCIIIYLSIYILLSLLVNDYVTLITITYTL